MIFRLTRKLCAKLKADSPIAWPLDENPFADWSASLFIANRSQYILVTNTVSLYSALFFGKGVTNESHFIERALGSIRELMEADGLAFIYHRLIVLATGTVRFAKAYDRSVTGSMNDLVVHSKAWLADEELSPFDVALKLNDIPFSSLKYSNPREAFKGLQIRQPR